METGMNRYAIGRRIESYRDKLKMSTQELAERIKRSQATISRIENGKQGLTPELLATIAVALRIHPFALLSDDPPRTSALLPPDVKVDESAQNLLSNFLHGGRIKSGLRLDDAALALGIQADELDAVEISASVPDDELLGRQCELYGLELAAMRALRDFVEKAPDLARELACLQRMSSHVYHTARETEPGGETAALNRIARLMESSLAGCPPIPESSNDDINLFLDRLSLHLVNALKDRDFRSKVMELANYEEENDPRSVPNLEPSSE